VDPDRLLAGLDDQQVAAVTAPSGIVAVLAAAGSGKTTVLTRRLAYRVATGTADARHSVAITFTREAAAELRRRLHRLDVHDQVMAGTFHATAYSLLRQRWSDQGRSVPTIIGERWRLLREVCPTSAGEHVPGELGTEIDWARARLISPERYEGEAMAAARRPSQGAARVVERWKAYDELKRRRNVVDLDDLLVQLLADMHRDTTFAQVVQWRLRHLHVDEAQDLNPLQHGVLEMLRAGRDDLFLVGDPAQAIYGWNGAEPRLLREVDITYPRVQVIRLDRNRRSTPEIVDTARRALSTTDLPVHIVAARPDGDAVMYAAFDDEVAEAQGIARWLLDQRRPGAALASMAVLVRTNAQVGTIREALERVGLAVRARRGRGPLDAAVSEAADQGGLHRLLAWASDIADMTLPDSNDDMTSARRQVAALVDEFVADTGGGDGRSFAGWVRSTDALGELGARHDGIDVMTFHAAKGREWPVVVIAGFERRLVPHSTARTAEAKAEETRLAYVAVTRAGDRLLVTWARRRRDRDSGPSALVDVMRVTPDPVVAPPAEVRRVMATTVDTPNVLEALRRWRSAAARSAAVDPVVVCTDAELRRLARESPSHLDEVAEVVGPLFARRHGDAIVRTIADAQSARSTITGA
jgi:DNA helicase-2/ATP-dependent DNA helicase PcrA